jgi:hypothetical protein
MQMGRYYSGIFGVTRDPLERAGIFFMSTASRTEYITLSIELTHMPLLLLDAESAGSHGIGSWRFLLSTLVAGAA